MKELRDTGPGAPDGLAARFGDWGRPVLMSKTEARKTVQKIGLTSWALGLKVNCPVVRLNPYMLPRVQGERGKKGVS